MRKKSIVIAIDLLVSAMMLPLSVSAQKSAISVNAGDVLCLGTIGVELNYAVSQKWSIDIGVRVNPWTYNKEDSRRQTQLRHQTYAVGARYWLSHAYSGIWFGAKAQYQEYNRGGFNGRLQTEEGDAFGLGIELGYSWMLSRMFSINFGLGGWGGYTYYKKYECPFCGRVTDSGNKLFVLPDELIIGMVFMF